MHALTLVHPSLPSSLGVNAKNNKRGSINPRVYLAFIALQAAGPFVAFFLPSPSKVQRTDGLPVRLYANTRFWAELKATWRLFSSKRFLLIVPLISQAVFNESFSGTYLTLYFTVRSRALGSFLGAVMSIIAGNILGWYLDRTKISLHVRARWAFAVILTLQGAWWVWSTYIQVRRPRASPLPCTRRWH